MVSERNPKKIKKRFEKDIEVYGSLVGKIALSEDIINSFTKILKGYIEFHIKEENELHHLHFESILCRDIYHLIEMGVKGDGNLEAICHAFFKRVGTYLPFECGSIYLEIEDDILEEICRVGEDVNDSDKKKQFEFARLCFRNQRIYSYESEAMICFPLGYSGQSLGAFCLSKLLVSTMNKNEIYVIMALISGLTHPIRKYQTDLFKNKSEQITFDLKSYVSDHIYESIMDDKNMQFETPEKKNVVCMFCDIRSFTSISEQCAPQQLVELLNHYFNHLIPVIVENKGMVDKLVGDMIAACWNIPSSINSPEVHALRAAINMQKFMINKVAPLWVQGGIKHVGIGIGLHCGMAHTGHIGSRDFNNYTVMGKVPSLAKFFESKARPGEILISSAMQKLVEGKVPQYTKKVSDLVYDGKNINAYVYRPLDYPDYTIKKC